MKRFLSVLLTILILQSLFLLPITAQTEEKLTNQKIVEMVKGGFSNEIIIAKIKSSITAFDTSLPALDELRKNNVSDAIIVVMVGEEKPSAVPLEIVIPDGTAIEVALRNDLSGQTAKVGDEVVFVVVRDIKVNGVTVIEKESFAVGKIVAAQKSRYWGRKGVIGWEMQSIITTDGNKIPVRAVKGLEGDSKRAEVAAGVAATAFLLGPAALLWGLKKGESAYISAGTYYFVYVNGETKVKVRQ